MARSINFLSFGAYLPQKVLTNADLEALVETSDEWIVRRTGIKTRHIIAENEDVVDLAFKASEDCFSKVRDVNFDKIDGVIVATCSSPNRMPAVANLLQKKLGISRPVISFDINAACSGFLYSLSIVDSLVKASKGENFLLVGVDAMSTLVDWSDRDTCVLFGDGAGAVLIGSSNKGGGVIYDAQYCDAELSVALCAKVGGFIKMDGRKVFETAIKKLTVEIKKALELSELTVDQIDYLVMHQANIRIIDSISSKIGIDPSKIVITVDQCANTSAASIPITLNTLHGSGKMKSGSNIVIAAMGAGFTYGVMIMTL